MFGMYWQGFFLGAAIILPLGPRNAYAMNQGFGVSISDDCPAVRIGVAGILAGTMTEHTKSTARD